MPLFKSILSYALLIFLVGGGLWLLYIMVRYSIVSPILTKNAHSRLRHPVPEGIPALCGVEPPPELIDFYLTHPSVERFEFSLVDTSSKPEKRWDIGQFIPMTPLDVGEWRKVTHCHGIPFALDLDKGVYVLEQSGTIALLSPNVAGGRELVATAFSEFAAFAAVDIPVSADDD